MSESEQSKADFKAAGAELQEAYSGSAVRADRFICAVRADVRLAFLEYDPDRQPRFRTAVSLSIEDAYALRRLLDNVLPKREGHAGND